MGFYKEEDKPVVIQRLQQYYNRVKLACWEEGMHINKAPAEHVDALLKKKRFRQPLGSGRGWCETKEEYDNA